MPLKSQSAENQKPWREMLSVWLPKLKPPERPLWQVEHSRGRICEFQVAYEGTLVIVGIGVGVPVPLPVGVGVGVPVPVPVGVPVGVSVGVPVPSVVEGGG